MTHDDIRNLLGAMSLDALGAPEEREVGEHLEWCAGCRQELATCREVAGALALLAEARRPSPGLRERILVGIAAGPAPPVPRVALWHRLVGRNGMGLRSYHRFQARLASGQPGARLYPSEPGSAVTGTLYVAEDGDSGWLAATHVPDPGHAVYQVWAILGGKPAPVAAFRPGRSGCALVWITGGLAAASVGSVTAVTLEDRAGRQSPQGALVMSGPARS